MDPREVFEGKDNLGLAMRMAEMFRESFEPRGEWKVFHNDIEVDGGRNLIVTGGHNLIAHRFGTATPSNANSIISHAAIGTGTTAAAAAQTALVTEATGLTRVAASLSISNATITTTTEFGANNPTAQATITEAGLFNASSSGTMYNRITFTGRLKATTDSLSIAWTLTF